jgi:ribonucleoside-diphosphate reductase alpha chain
VVGRNEEDVYMIFKTSLARENWETKYRYNGETQLGTWQRVARALAEVERTHYGATDAEVGKWYDRFLKTLVKFEEIESSEVAAGQEEFVYQSLDGKTYLATGLKSTPGGRITANAGTAYAKATPWNCFISSPVSGAMIQYSKKVPNTDELIACTIQTDQTPDNLTNIFLSLLEAAETLKSEGGYGMNFGFIRPRGSFIKGVGIKHPGVVSYMELWDKMSAMIVKGDNDGYADRLQNYLEAETHDRIEKVMPRKGAMLAALPIWHPDIEEFVRAKQVAGRLTKFNISVLVDDRFMEAVENDDFYNLTFNGKVYKRVKAVDLYNLIMESTYLRAEPGVLFLDNMNRQNPLIYLGPVTASNPCGEIPGSSLLDASYEPASYLKPYMGDAQDDFLIGFTTVCLLGSINLTQFVRQDRTFDFDAYKETVHVFSRMLDNVNDMGLVPLPAYEWAVKNIRQYGMGINGLGSALYMMGLAYGSDEGNEFVSKINFIKDDETLRTSALLARERGAFPMYSEKYLETPYFRDYCTASEESKALVRQYGLRNAKRLTNPPLGNSSVICDMTSNGIEPVFSFGYNRTVMTDEWPEGMTLDNVQSLLSETVVGDATVWKGEYHGRTWYYEPHNRGLCFIEPVEDYGFAWVRENYPQDLEGQSLSDFSGQVDAALGSELPSQAVYLVTAQDLDVMTHVRVQSLFQSSCDQSISKTANVPHDYPFDNFKNLYAEAWKAGLVGFTTYRAGTMEAVLSTGSEDTSTGFKPVAGNLLPSLMDLGCTPEDAKVTADNVVVRAIRLPDTFKNGPTKKITREGTKYYMHLSYLPNDELNPIAFWIHSNDYQEGEYVTLNRAFRAVTKLLMDRGVDMDLVLDQVEKLKSDAYHVKLGKIISMCLRHNIDLPSIVASISDIDGDYIATTLTAVRKFLSEHIADGTKITGKVCDACGSSNIIFEGGCDKCLDCGGGSCQ